MKKPKVLFYDIETCLLNGWLFRPGKQVFGHKQLLKGYFYHTHIISICYQINDNKPVFLHWGESDDDEREMIRKFDEVIKSCDVVIGKNNRRFDDKHIATKRMIYGMEGMPEWVHKCDDLETQIRRTFFLPSFSLDYFSELLGLGGKISMEFQDWVDLAEYRMLQLGGQGSEKLVEVLTGRKHKDIKRAGKAALKKMGDYNPKDVTDTKAIWDYCVRHFQPRFNHATYQQAHVCINCGSNNIRKNGTRTSGKTIKQSWFCKDHGGFAGYTNKPWKMNDKMGG